MSREWDELYRLLQTLITAGWALTGTSASSAASTSARWQRITLDLQLPDPEEITPTSPPA